ncbi:MAG: AMP-binding protein [Candidatus Omnitrophica bacterium]|nr:AMP-binding protein [Candidatus Omnitrophota bacterium]
MDPWRNIARLSQKEIRDLQNKKLASFVRNYLYPFSPYYRKLFDQHNIDPKSIRTADDLKRVPFTSKRDFIAPDENPEKFRDFILQPTKETIRKYWPLAKTAGMAFVGAARGKEYLQDQLAREFRPSFMTFTTGTTDKPIPHVYSEHDMGNLRTSGSRMLHLFDIAGSDRIVNMFPYAPHLAFWQVVFGGLDSSVLIMSTGGGRTLGTDGNIAALLKVNPAVLVGVPCYIYHVLREARKGNCRMEFLKKVVLGASKVNEGFKAKVAELLYGMGTTDVSVMGTYGFTEARTAWGECPTGINVSSGYHLYPDKEIFEVIDPETGEVKPEGQDGELVYSSIDARGSVVLRYRTGDFVKGGITYQPCPHCGRSVPRIASDITRLSDVKDLQLSKIKGSLVNLNNFMSILSDMAPVDEWQVELRKKDNDPFEVDEVVVYISKRAGADEAQIKEEIRKKMLLMTEITPNEVHFIGFNEMISRLQLETANKTRRIVDLRPKS